MKSRNLLYVLVLSFFNVIHAQTKSASNAEKEVRKVLKEQEMSWNKGDLKGFMQGYWNDEQLVFVGAKGPTYGYRNTLLSYQKGYPDKSSMGTLNFDIIHVYEWDEKTLLLIGKYTLNRLTDQPTGYFTLLFRKINNKWKIVSDHTSAENIE